MDFKTDELTAREVLLAFRASGNDEMADRFDAMFRLLASRSLTKTYDGVLDLTMNEVETLVPQMLAALNDQLSAAASRQRVRDFMLAAAKGEPTA